MATPAPASVPADQVEWWNLWGKLKQAAADLDAALAKLESQRAYVATRPNLQTDYAKQMADVASLRSKVTWLRDAIRSTMSNFGVQLSGLGFVWIPVAVVAAGVAYVASSALDAWKLAKRIDEQQRLESTGMSPAQAAQLVTSQATAGTLGGALQNVAVIAAVGLAAWWLLGRKR